MGGGTPWDPRGEANPSRPLHPLSRPEGVVLLLRWKQRSITECCRTAQPIAEQSIPLQNRTPHAAEEPCMHFHVLCRDKAALLQRAAGCRVWVVGTRWAARAPSRPAPHLSVAAFAGEAGAEETTWAHWELMGTAGPGCKQRGCKPHICSSLLILGLRGFCKANCRRSATHRRAAGMFWFGFSPVLHFPGII